MLAGWRGRRAQGDGEMEERFLAQRNDPQYVDSHDAVLKQQNGGGVEDGHEQGEVSSSTAGAGRIMRIYSMRKGRRIMRKKRFF